MSIKKCRNKCIFCFIDQLPPGLRDTLYLKDDDYIESFKYGNFITLTNLNDKDISKIIRYNLSPLYISFHSADTKTRDFIFNNGRQSVATDYLKILDKNNIITNIQIVACPGINDGYDLINTLTFLNNLNNVNSIGIVPVGITKYNRNENLISFNKYLSAELIESVEIFIKNKKIRNIYISDEFYIIADKTMPLFDEYNDFPQIENGIGMISDFRNDFIKFTEKSLILHNKSNTNDERRKNINKTLVLTSEYSKNFIDSLIKELKRRIKDLNISLNLNVKVKPVKNKMFGGNVRVMGLISFQDIREEILKINKFDNYDKIFISDIIFNKDGITLDNKKKNDFMKISEKIIFVKNNGKSFAKELLKK